MEKSSKDGIKLFGATITLEEPTRSSDPMKRPEKIVGCPRCKSMDTKFCYFNNYNVNQPRHFCKGCHRYWTAGGALRNVPVGAGRRKNKPLPILYHPPQHYFQSDNNSVEKYSWHLMAAPVKRRRNGEVDT